MRGDPFELPSDEKKTRRVSTSFVLMAAIAVAATLAFPSYADDEKGPAVVEDGKTIKIEYTLKTDDGSVVDTSEGRQPLSYEQGGQQILPALEAELAGMQVGQEKSVTLTAEQGYGVRDPAMLQEVPASAVPPEAHEPGTQLVSQDQQGNQHVVRVHEVKGDVIVMDLNHPLADETLHFDVKIVGVE